jgi:hypothetical protein
MDERRLKLIPSYPRMASTAATVLDDPSATLSAVEDMLAKLAGLPAPTTSSAPNMLDDMEDRVGLGLARQVSEMLRGMVVPTPPPVLAPEDRRRALVQAMIKSMGFSNGGSTAWVDTVCERWKSLWGEEGLAEFDAELALMAPTPACMVTLATDINTHLGRVSPGFWNGIGDVSNMVLRTHTLTHLARWVAGNPRPCGADGTGPYESQAIRLSLRRIRAVVRKEVLVHLDGEISRVVAAVGERADRQAFVAMAARMIADPVGRAAIDAVNALSELWRN